MRDTEGKDWKGSRWRKKRGSRKRRIEQVLGNIKKEMVRQKKKECYRKEE